MLFRDKGKDVVFPVPGSLVITEVTADDEACESGLTCDEDPQHEHLPELQIGQRATYPAHPCPGDRVPIHGGEFVCANPPVGQDTLSRGGEEGSKACVMSVV